MPIKLLIILFILFTNVTASFGLSSDTLKESVEQRIQKGLQLLANDKENTLENPQKIFDLLDPIFNYPLMARLSLGTPWNTLTTQQKEIFTHKYEEKLKESFLLVLSHYSDEKIIIGDLTPHNNRLHLSMDIKYGNNLYGIEFKFHEASNDFWLIYDLEILGVSVVRTFRNVFASYTGESFDQLMNLFENLQIQR